MPFVYSWWWWGSRGKNENALMEKAFKHHHNLSVFVHKKCFFFRKLLFHVWIFLFFSVSAESQKYAALAVGGWRLLLWKHFFMLLSCKHEEKNSKIELAEDFLFFSEKITHKSMWFIHERVKIIIFFPLASLSSTIKISSSFSYDIFIHTHFFLARYDMRMQVTYFRIMVSRHTDRKC